MRMIQQKGVEKKEERFSTFLIVLMIVAAISHCAMAMDTPVPELAKSYFIINSATTWIDVPAGT